MFQASGVLKEGGDDRKKDGARQENARDSIEEKAKRLQNETLHAKVLPKRKPPDKIPDDGQNGGHVEKIKTGDRGQKDGEDQDRRFSLSRRALDPQKEKREVDEGCEKMRMLHAEMHRIGRKHIGQGAGCGEKRRNRLSLKRRHSK